MGSRACARLWGQVERKGTNMKMYLLAIGLLSGIQAFAVQNIQYPGDQDGCKNIVCNCTTRDGTAGGLFCKSSELISICTNACGPGTAFNVNVSGGIQKVAQPK